MPVNPGFDIQSGILGSIPDLEFDVLGSSKASATAGENAGFAFNDRRFNGRPVLNFFALFEFEFLKRILPHKKQDQAEYSHDDDAIGVTINPEVPINVVSHCAREIATLLSDQAMRMAELICSAVGERIPDSDQSGVGAGGSDETVDVAGVRSFRQLGFRNLELAHDVEARDFTFV